MSLKQIILAHHWYQILNPEPATSGIQPWVYDSYDTDLV